MTRSTRVALLVILSLVLVATRFTPHPTLTAAATLAPPHFKAKGVLRLIASPAGRQRFGLGPQVAAASPARAACGSNLLTWFAPQGDGYAGGAGYAVEFSE